MKHRVLLLFLALSTALVAQQPTKSLTFTGMVFDRETLKPLPEAIYLKKDQSFALSPEGKFRIQAFTGDTIRFSHIGYKDLILTLEDTLDNMEYLTGIYLSPALTLLSEVVIVPRYYSLQALVASDPVKQAKEQAYAERNLRLSAYQGLQPVKKMDNEMNQKMDLQKHRTSVEYKKMLSPDQLIGINFVTVVPDTKGLVEGLRHEGLSIDLGSVTTQEEEDYLRLIYRALNEEKKMNKSE